MNIGKTNVFRVHSHNTSMADITVGRALLFFFVFFSFPLGLDPTISNISADENQVIPTEVSLLVREREILVFDGVKGTWVSERIFSGEKVIDKKAGGHVAIVVTNTRVLGYSAKTNFWAVKRLIAGEGFVSLEVADNVGTVVTDLRALGFSARQGQWSETKLALQ